MNYQRAKARGILRKAKATVPPLRSGQAFIPSLERHGVFGQVFIKQEGTMKTPWQDYRELQVHNSFKV